jgi:hypothetical protein
MTIHSQILVIYAVCAFSAPAGSWASLYIGNTNSKRGGGARCVAAPCVSRGSSAVSQLEVTSRI